MGAATERKNAANGEQPDIFHVTLVNLDWKQFSPFSKPRARDGDIRDAASN
jgi:hypothetical protein